jgi:hypothetical protein|tara:strand:+ start:691 stop:993 length:303 start_codon:yes stop_codon:yes gene_type:complete
MKDKKEWLFYSYQVRNLTEKTIRREFLDNSNLRSKDFHCDHKLSILEGFKQGVPVEIMADICNLEIIPKTENLKKGSKSSITFNELLEEISQREYDLDFN